MKNNYVLQDMIVKKTLERGENRILGGVCSVIAEKYNFPTWLLRLVFVITTIIFTFPILIYLIMWIVIPNKNITKQIDKKRKYLLQTLGIIIGGIVGWYVGYGFGMYSIGDDKSGFLVVIIFALIGIPFGVITGFSTARVLSEKNMI